MLRKRKLNHKYYNKILRDQKIKSNSCSCSEPKKELSIIVFPSLALIRQYTNYYLQDIQAQKSHKILDISSEILDYFTITTDPLKIKKFLKLKKSIVFLKIIV
jgi:hypothetical protein